MKNVHPLFVHFPLALLTLACLLQLVGVAGRRERCLSLASLFLYLGTAGALLSVLTGWLAEEQIEGLAGFTPAIEAVLDTHATLMFLTTGLAVFLSFLAFWLRGRMSRAWQAILLLGLLVLVSLAVLGADRGGQLVYEFGVGTQKMAAPALPHSEGESTR
jgi:uncharacterized membrane protein